MSSSPRTRWGPFVRRECWTLSPAARWVGALGGVVLCVLVVLCVNPFLSVDRPVSSRFLVVEGWIPDYALEIAAHLANSNKYDRIFTTGGPLVSGRDLDPEDTYAHLAAAKLVEFGLDPSARLQPVPAPRHRRDRTYTSAVALRKWTEQEGLNVESLDLFTFSVHARRSRLLFSRAFGGNVRIGVIAVRNREYDPRRWWRYSEGIKEVVGEGLAYVYAKLFVLAIPSDR